MDKDFFFIVWKIYRDHWGQDNHDMLLRQQSKEMLGSRIKGSSKILSTLLLYRFMNNEPPFTACKADCFSMIKDLSETCLGEEYGNWDKYGPAERMNKHIHPYTKVECMSPNFNQWKHLKFPIVSHIGGLNDPCIWRVSSILSFH